MYQVIWSHELVLLFGNTTEAVGTIVTAFMAGLGLGGLVGGLLAPRLRRALRLYGVIELAVAGLALLVPVGFQLIETAYRSVYDTSSPGQLTLSRLLLSLATVTPVTFLMGLTLPLLTRHMVTSMRDAGAHMGRLYAANTFGAMLGTLVSGFVLIELIGLAATTRVAVGLNVLAAAVALVASLRVPPLPARATLSAAAAGEAPLAAVRRNPPQLLYEATFVSGFVALALEVLWTRMISEGTGSSIYVFAMILAVFLLGIAGGGWIYGVRSTPDRDTTGALVLVAASAGSLRAAPLRLTAGIAVTVALPVLLVVTGSPLLLTATQHRLDFAGLPYHHTEDRLSTVDAVGGDPSNRTLDRRLYTAGTSMTALSVDTKLMAYVPRIMRQNAEDFLDICFGMGTTFRSALLLGMNVDAVDLSPSVPWQMSTFNPDADRFLHSPQARIITADGRNYVHLTSRRYDLISVDPPPPIESAGAVVLYSREFYADARRVLRPGGLMLQWLYFGLDMDQFREHLRSFRSAFPHVSILISPRGGGIYMLGSDSPITWDDSTVDRFLGTSQAATDLRDAPDFQYLPKFSWPEILRHALWLRDDEVDRFAGSGPMITDDAPLTEYYMLHALLTPNSEIHVTEAALRVLWPSP